MFIRNQHYLFKVDNYSGTFKKANIITLQINEVTRAIMSSDVMIAHFYASLHTSNPDLRLTSHGVRTFYVFSPVLGEATLLHA